ncbi:MAG: hypothetical protein Q8M03_02090, partial [Legionella sp.]|nr:hypothetical protein [Legionella sp.]
MLFNSFLPDARLIVDADAYFKIGAADPPSNSLQRNTGPALYISSHCPRRLVMTQVPTLSTLTALLLLIGCASVP